MYVLLKALQLYGNSVEDLVLYNTHYSAVKRVNDAIEGKILDHDDDVRQIVETATKIGFHTHLNPLEKKLKVSYCDSVKNNTNVEDGVHEFREKTPSWWSRRCECLALRSSHYLSEFKYRCDTHVCTK